MFNDIKVQLLSRDDTATIASIASWYNDEWNIPIERTVQRLSMQEPSDLLFHLVLYIDNHPIATGGVHLNVGLLKEHPRFFSFSSPSPWVAVLYTVPQHRGRDLGAKLLTEIEKQAKAIGLKKLFLYTFTAEKLYLRNGWTPTERLTYKGHDTVVMEKSL
jgi:GNAT superfamily N-acetyltransferase